MGWKKPFLNSTSKAQTTKKKTDQLEFIKIKNVFA